MYKFKIKLIVFLLGNKKLTKTGAEGTVFDEIERFSFFTNFTSFYTLMNFVGCVVLSF
jgi:hypothetical protein